MTIGLIIRLAAQLASYYGWTNAFDALALSDTDQDGMPAWAEYRAGTDPTNKYSALALKQPGASVSESGVIIQWSSVTNKFYAIDRSTNLNLGFVDTLESNVSATAPVNSYSDTNAIGSGPYFYRIKLE